jgi:hypothetical protein
LTDAPNNFVVFHYIGDHIRAAYVAENTPHRLAVVNKNTFVRRLPEVDERIKAKFSSTAEPAKVPINLQNIVMSWCRC